MAIPGYRGTTPKGYAPPYSKYYPAEYFSTMDLSVFFDPGDGSEPVYIDEITGLSFTMTERVVPVYGYADFTARRMVHGARIVQGQFSINMQPGNYLHELVNSLAGIANSAAPPSAVSYVRPDPAADPDGYANWVGAQKNQYWGQIAALAQPAADAATVRSQPYFTAPGFTIVMIAGDVDAVDLSRNSGRVRTIDGVNLFSTGQMLDLSPEAIGETFGFLAVDVNQDSRLNPIL